MAYSVQQVATAAELALAIAAIPEWVELVEVAEVDGGYWLITEPDDDDVVVAPCCCDCHNDATDAVAAAPSMGMSMSRNAEDIIKNVTAAIDKIAEAAKNRK